MGAFNIRNLVREIQGKYLPKPTTTEDGKVITYNDTTQSFEYNEYANTASNLGTSADGEGLFDSKSDVDLQFKRIKAGTNISLTSETNDIEIGTTNISNDPIWDTKGDLAVGTGNDSANVLTAPDDTEKLLHKNISGALEWSYPTIDGGSS
jgi:hypothetical protein